MKFLSINDAKFDIILADPPYERFSFFDLIPYVSKILDEEGLFCYETSSKEKENLDKSNFAYEEIKNLYFFPSKRWDIEFKNNKILKLPEKSEDISLDYLFKFFNDKNFSNIKIIDARIKNQIILND